MAVYKCPICDGKGFMPKSFYAVPGETVSFASYREMQNQRTPCMSCFGRGIIIDTPVAYPSFCAGLGNTGKMDLSGGDSDEVD